MQNHSIQYFFAPLHSELRHIQAYSKLFGPSFFQKYIKIWSWSFKNFKNSNFDEKYTKNIHPQKKSSHAVRPGDIGGQCIRSKLLIQFFREM